MSTTIAEMTMMQRGRESWPVRTGRQVELTEASRVSVAYGLVDDQPHRVECAREILRRHTLTPRPEHGWATAYLGDLGLAERIVWVDDHHDEIARRLDEVVRRVVGLGLADLPDAPPGVERDGHGPTCEHTGASVALFGHHERGGRVWYERAALVRRPDWMARPRPGATGAIPQGAPWGAAEAAAT